MSGQPWKAHEAEADHHGRDVLHLYFMVADSANEGIDVLAGDLAAALQKMIYMLDDRSTGNRKKAALQDEHAFYEAVRGEASLHLVSCGTADLFGITPVTRAAGRMVQLVSDTRSVERLQQRCAELPAATVLAYEHMLNLLAAKPAALRLEWTAPSGEQAAAELSIEELQRACAMINEVTVTEEHFPVKGTLTMLNPAKRTFHMVGEDGQSYKGRLSDSVRQQYGKEREAPMLPVKAEAVMERRTTLQVCVQIKSFADTLIELDTNIGLDVQETYYTMQELYERLDIYLDSDDSDFIPRLAQSLAAYAELAPLLDELAASPPAKGAHGRLEAADLMEALDLLAPGRPISRLVQFSEQLLPAHETGEYHGGSAAQASQRKHSDKLSQYFTAAYANHTRLLKLLVAMIHALE